MTADDGGKAIADPVHGTIRLNTLEARVMSTRAFQRLRNVKQLGLAAMVFPGADYSRFSHSLGVCHVAQRILNALKSSGATFNANGREEQQYRLAGLLHDIGHYPFSHAFETAIQNHYATRIVEGQGAPARIENSWLNHEAVGKQLLLQDPQLPGILKSEGIDPETVYQIFTRGRPDSTCKFD